MITRIPYYRDELRDFLGGIALAAVIIVAVRWQRRA